jgi:hypothetical protein
MFFCLPILPFGEKILLIWPTSICQPQPLDLGSWTVVISPPYRKSPHFKTKSLADMWARPSFFLGLFMFAFTVGLHILESVHNQ